MAIDKHVQDTHISAQIRSLHGALITILGVMNRPQVDERMVREAGIALDRALFPLLVSVERVGPIGVVELADRVGRDYTTVSRQVAKLEQLGLVARRPGAHDARVREAIVTTKGKRMAQAVDVARVRIGRAIFKSWDDSEVDQFVRLLNRFAADIEARTTPDAHAAP